MTDSRAAFARNLIPLGDVDHIDERIHQLRRKRRSEIVAPALHKNELKIGKLRLKRPARLLVHRRVVANSGVRTPARFHARDPSGRPRAVLNKKLRILGTINVVGHNSH